MRPSPYTAIVTAAALFALPIGAAADPLERIADANTAMAAQMEAFYLARVPELADKIPDFSWNGELRAAGSCFVDGYLAERGADGLEDYVVALEAWGAVEITSFEQLSFGMPAILTEPLPMSLTQDCGIMDISIQRAQDSGFIEALSDPAVMARVMGQ